MNIEDSSRRSFLKKTVAMTVGVSSLTIFSGLTHATIVKYSNGYSCQWGSDINKESRCDGDLMCLATLTNDPSQTIVVKCTDPEWPWCPDSDCEA